MSSEIQKPCKLVGTKSIDTVSDDEQKSPDFDLGKAAEGEQLGAPLLGRTTKMRKHSHSNFALHMPVKSPSNQPKLRELGCNRHNHVIRSVTRLRNWICALVAAFLCDLIDFES